MKNAPERRADDDRWPRLGRRVRGRLRRMGVTIDPFFIVREGLDQGIAPVSVDPRFQAGLAGPEDIDELVRVEPGITPEQCTERFQQGKLCFAVKEGARIVAKTWCDLDELNDALCTRPLAPHEAYLFNAYTDMGLRGQSLAPYLRQQCYAGLRARGRDTFYSVTDAFNLASRRFKAKLGAVEEVFCLHLDLFGRWSHTFMWRKR